MRASPRAFPTWLRLALGPLVAAVVLAGIWAAGGLLTDDFRLAMASRRSGWASPARRRSASRGGGGPSPSS